MSKAAVTAYRLVPILNPGEEGQACLDGCFSGAQVKKFTLYTGGLSMIDGSPTFTSRKLGQCLKKEGILTFLATRVANWWALDDVVFLSPCLLAARAKHRKNDLQKDYAIVFS